MYYHSAGRSGCGLADLFVARRHDKRDDFDLEPAENLGCVVNSAFADAGQTYFEDEATGIRTLYLTRQNNLATTVQVWDTHATTRRVDDSGFDPAVLVTELSSP